MCNDKKQRNKDYVFNINNRYSFLKYLRPTMFRFMYSLQFVVIRYYDGKYTFVQERYATTYYEQCYKRKNVVQVIYICTAWYTLSDRYTFPHISTQYIYVHNIQKECNKQLDTVYYKISRKRTLKNQYICDMCITLPLQAIQHVQQQKGTPLHRSLPCCITIVILTCTLCR